MVTKFVRTFNRDRDSPDGKKVRHYSISLLE